MKKTFNHSFTNQYGMALTAAVMCIGTAQINKSANISLSTDLASGSASFGDNVINENSNANVNYDVIYFIDEDAHANKLQPMQFERRSQDLTVEEERRANDPAMLVANGLASFSFSVDADEITTAEQLEDACLAHLKTEILKLES